MTESGDEQTASEFAARADEPADTDELGFDAYVEAVQEFVTHDSTEPPLTISIEGEWGSGKSSFMQQLKRSLDKKGKKTIEFNPWKHEKQESLWAAFALRAVQDLRDEFGWAERSKKHLGLLYRRYVSNGSIWTTLKITSTVIALAIPAILLILLWLQFGAGVVVDAIGLDQRSTSHWVLILQIGGVLTALVSYMRIWAHFRSDFVGSLENNLLRHASDPGYENKVGFLNSFHDDLEQIIDIYAGEEERVFVFIDDLDRCSVPRTAELMQAINLLLSDDNRLIFILGLDRKRVAAGMAAKHGELLKILDESSSEGADRLSFGYQYLEKFIQIPFLVPEPKEDDLRRLISGGSSSNTSKGDIRESWESITQEYDEKLDDIVDMVVPALGSNPRQVKRFMNLYKLRTVLAEIEGVLDLGETSSSSEIITLEQLSKFVIISIQWPQLISKIYNDPTAIENLIWSIEGEEDADLSGLESWSSDTQLLDLLTYGEGPEYDIQNVNIETLMKISPRVDIPTESETGHGSVDRKVQICHFTRSDDGDYTDRLDLSVIKPAEVRVDVVKYNTLNESRRSNQSRALQSYIWIVESSFQNDDEFERLYEYVPEETEVIFVGDTIPDEVASEYPGAIIAESLAEVENIVRNSLKLISNPDEDAIWHKWRDKATRARDDYVHEI
jgi:hypothetical protein